jgi:filamentous hemagglutinin
MNRLRVLWPIIVVGAVLIGGFLISSLLRDRAVDDDESTVAAETTAAAEVASETARATPTPARAGSTSATPARARTATLPASQARDLTQDEERGGHTLSRHVGKSDTDLRARLQREPEISAASSYVDQAAAEATVGKALADNRKKVDDWAKSGSSRPNLVLRVSMKDVIGRTIERGARAPVDVTAAVVVLRADGAGWYVLTSYPEDR